MQEKKIEAKDKANLLLSFALVSQEEQKTSTNVAFVIIFCHNLVRTTEDEKKCNTRNHLLCKGTRVKKRQRKKRGDVHLPQMHWLSFKRAFSATPLQQRLLQHHFNISSTTSSSVASFQHHLCNVIFCSNTSTPLLQHHFLQCCFDTAFATLFFIETLQHHFCF
jgi:hypothetical protein